nr:disulfide isomerase [Salmonella sp. NCTC 7297]
MSQADFEAALKDPAVQETLEKWKAAYDVAKIQGVPAYVVNGSTLSTPKTSNPSILWLNSFGNWPLKNKQGNDYGFY